AGRRSGRRCGSGQLGACLRPDRRGAAAKRHGRSPYDNTRGGSVQERPAVADRPARSAPVTWGADCHLLELQLGVGAHRCLRDAAPGQGARGDGPHSRGCSGPGSVRQGAGRLLGCSWYRGTRADGACWRKKARRSHPRRGPASGRRFAHKGCLYPEPAATDDLRGSDEPHPVAHRDARLHGSLIAGWANYRKSSSVSRGVNGSPAARNASSAPSKRSTRVMTRAISPPSARTASTALSAEPPVVVTSSTIMTGSPFRVSPGAKPSTRLRVP